MGTAAHRAWSPRHGFVSCHGCPALDSEGFCNSAQLMVVEPHHVPHAFHLITLSEHSFNTVTLTRHRQDAAEAELRVPAHRAVAPLFPLRGPEPPRAPATALGTALPAAPPRPCVSGVAAQRAPGASTKQGAFAEQRCQGAISTDCTLQTGTAVTQGGGGQGLGPPPASTPPSSARRTGLQLRHQPLLGDGVRLSGRPGPFHRCPVPGGLRSDAPHPPAPRPRP